MNNFGLDLENSTDDDFFGTLRNRSNLSQLFGVQTDNQSDDNHTLKYQPVKQSEHNIAVKVPAATAWQTQLVKVANGYRAGESVGKLGAALLHNGEGGWRMILYKSKTDVMSTVTLLPPPPESVGHELHLQSRYLQYYDDNTVYWSLFFEKQSDEREFLDKLQSIGVKIQQQQPPEQQQGKPTVPAAVQMEFIKLPIVTPSSDESTTVAGDADNSKHKHSKTALISRMAKMGQQLPKFATTATPTTTECSDSSDTEVLATPGALGGHKPVIVPRNQRNIQPAQTQIIPVASTSANTNVGLYNGAAMETQFMQMLLTENRTQNTEMRINMNKLEGKLEKVLDKIENFHSGNGQKSQKEDEILELEEKLLVLKKENRKLKQSLESKSRNNDDDLQARLLRVHKSDLDELGLTETGDLSSIIGELVDQIHTLQRNVQEGRENVTVVEQRLKHSEEQLKEESASHSNILQQKEELQKQLDNLQETMKSKEQQIIQLEQTHKEEQERLNRQLVDEQAQAISTVKTIMNSLYSNVATKLEATDQPNRDTILAILGKTIREETLKAIEKPAVVTKQ